MDTEQFERKVREGVGAKPFRPFLIELDDGQKLIVAEPHALMYGRHTSIFFGAGDFVQMFDHRAVVGIHQLAETAAS